MAGDDLESDDEFLNPVVDDEPQSPAVAEPPSRTSKQTTGSDGGKKRRRKERTDEQVAGGGKSEEIGVGGNDLPAKKKKIKREGSPKHLLLEASRGIADQGVDIQAAFLWTCFCHFLKMGGDQLEDVEKFKAGDFYSPPSSGEVEKHSDRTTKSVAEFLKGGAVSSMKRLKKWKACGSPMVIIVCLSARRAVAVLKQLASLNIRCAKLFAKHMNVEDQMSMLQEDSFGIAVGTPNRLLKLFETRSNDSSSETDNDGSNNGGALSLSQTELIVIDCHEDHKRFTVFTLNDTAPDLMRFIRVAALPQMQMRNTMKFAMF